MDDRDIVKRIGDLVADEHRLENAHVGAGLSDQEREKLLGLQAELDQCWDLLAQRRARRRAGQDPSGAHARSEATVEHYLQ